MRGVGRALAFRLRPGRFARAISLEPTVCWILCTALIESIETCKQIRSK